jgi:hypothetical protein
MILVHPLTNPAAPNVVCVRSDRLILWFPPYQSKLNKSKSHLLSLCHTAIHDLFTLAMRGSHFVSRKIN